MFHANSEMFLGRTPPCKEPDKGQGILPDKGQGAQPDKDKGADLGKNQDPQPDKEHGDEPVAVEDADSELELEKEDKKDPLLCQLAKMMGLIEDMYKVTSSTKNMQIVLKNSMEQLRFLTRDVIRKEKARRSEERKQAAKKQTGKDSRQIKGINDLIARCETADDLKDLLSREWPDGAYNNVSYLKASILRESPLRILIAREEDSADSVTWRNMANQFQGIAGEQGKNIGMVLSRIIQETGDDGLPSARALVAIRLPKDSTQWDDGVMIEKAVAKAIEIQEKYEALHETGPISCYMTSQGEAKAVNKLLELIARKRNVQIAVTQGRNKKRDTTQQARRAMRAPSGTSILLQREKGVSYADTLKRLGSTVDPTEYNVKVTRVQRLASGDMRLTVAETAEGATESFLEALTTKGGAQASRDISTLRRFIIRDLLEGTTQEDVEHALRQIVGSAAPLVVEKPQKGFRDRWSAVVRLNHTDTAKLAETGKVQIGWASCPISEWVNVPTCQRCQRVGHQARTCTFELVATKRCHKCGELGHVSNGCTKDPSCYNCGVAGHAANSSACPNYRSKITEARRERGGAGLVSAPRVTVAALRDPTAHPKSPPNNAQDDPDHTVNAPAEDDEGFRQPSRKRTIRSPPVDQRAAKSQNSNDAT